jgi:hypothetical protein
MLRASFVTNSIIIADSNELTYLLNLNVQYRNIKGNLLYTVILDTVLIFEVCSTQAFKWLTFIILIFFLFKFI